ncbi:uncharacterized protein LOC142021844 [Carettochelys insculpta]|uniref:uncharacterized protein LOC142021844 n=1 Tax=Carettochelys insculpta TaxID=44489 RepID=UPI003EBB4FE9
MWGKWWNATAFAWSHPEREFPPTAFLDNSGEELQLPKVEEQPGLGTTDWSSEEGELTILIPSRSFSRATEARASTDVTREPSATPSGGRDSPAPSLVPESPPAAPVRTSPQAGRCRGRGWRALWRPEEDPATQQQAEEHLHLAQANMEWRRAACDRMLDMLQGIGQAIRDHTATVAWLLVPQTTPTPELAPAATTRLTRRRYLLVVPTPSPPPGTPHPGEQGLQRPTGLAAQHTCPRMSAPLPPPS